jgi:hypothetical protein
VSHQDVVSEHSAYLLSPRYEDAWRPPLRDLILGRLWAQTAEMAERSRIAAPVVVIKEPTGSESADLLLRVLPGARLLVLHRDGRDVMDSELAALAPGTWATPLIGGRELGSEERLDWIRRWAALWLLRMEGLQRAYDERPHEQRMMIRYEDLLDDTPASVRALYDWLGLEISDAELDAVVARNDFASIPAELTGPKHFARAATPGLWRKNLSAAEQELLHELIGSKLRELGYED